jgi:hypothetical protein
MWSGYKSSQTRAHDANTLLLEQFFVLAKKKTKPFLGPSKAEISHRQVLETTTRLSITVIIDIKLASKWRRWRGWFAESIS